MKRMSKVFALLTVITLLVLTFAMTGCSFLGGSGNGGTGTNTQQPKDGWTKMSGDKVDPAEVYKYLFSKLDTSVGGSARASIGETVMYIDYSFKFDVEDFRFAVEIKKTAKGQERIGIYFDGEYIYFKAINATGKIGAAGLMEKISSSNSFTVAKLATFVNAFVELSGNVDAYSRMYGTFEERKYSYTLDLQSTFDNLYSLLKEAISVYLDGMDISSYLGTFLGIEDSVIEQGLTLDKNMVFSYNVFHEDNGGSSFSAEFVSNDKVTKNTALNITMTSMEDKWTIDIEDYEKYTTAVNTAYGVEIELAITEGKLVINPETKDYKVNLEFSIDSEIFNTPADELSGTGANELKLAVFDTQNNRVQLGLYLKDSHIYLSKIVEEELKYLSYEVDAGEFMKVIKTIDFKLLTSSIKASDVVGAITGDDNSKLVEINAMLGEVEKALEAAIVLPENEELDFWGDMEATFGESMTKVGLASYFVGNKFKVSIDKDADYIYSVYNNNIVYPDFVTTEPAE